MKNIVVAGNVTRDAELREHKGTPVLKFSVAVQDGYGANKSVLYFDCAYWGKAAQAIVNYVKKGIKISVSGEFSMRIYNDKPYLDIRASAVTLLGGKAREEVQHQEHDAPQRDIDDEIPW